jgi:hypothetical protein
MNPHRENDPVLNVYRDLGSPEPPETLDLAILAHARASNRRPWHHAPQFVWPISAAAAVLLAVGLVSQLAPMLPAPGHAEIQMPGPIQQPRTEPLPPAPPVGQEYERADQGIDRGVLEFHSESPANGNDASLAPSGERDVPLAVQVAAWREAAEYRARNSSRTQQSVLELLRELAVQAPETDHELLLTYFNASEQWPEMSWPQDIDKAVEAALGRAQVTPDTTGQPTDDP